MSEWFSAISWLAEDRGLHSFGSGLLTQSFLNRGLLGRSLPTSNFPALGVRGLHTLLDKLGLGVVAVHVRLLALRYSFGSDLRFSHTSTGKIVLTLISASGPAAKRRRRSTWMYRWTILLLVRRAFRRASMRAVKNSSVSRTQDDFSNKGARLVLPLWTSIIDLETRTV